MKNSLYCSGVVSSHIKLKHSSGPISLALADMTKPYKLGVSGFDATALAHVLFTIITDNVAKKTSDDIYWP